MSRQGFELKTNEQIILMREAGLATAAALKAVREAIKPGVSTLELDKIAHMHALGELGARAQASVRPDHGVSAHVDLIEPTESLHSGAGCYAAVADHAVRSNAHAIAQRYRALEHAIDDDMDIVAA